VIVFCDWNHAAEARKWKGKEWLLFLREEFWDVQGLANVPFCGV
jgi:hypothetical protein